MDRPRRRRSKPGRITMSLSIAIHRIVGALHRRLGWKRILSPTSSYGILCVALVVTLGAFAMLCVVSTTIWIYQHSQCYSREATVTWKEGIEHSLPRPCPAIDYPTVSSTHTGTTPIDPASICLTTLSDSAKAQQSRPPTVSWWSSSSNNNNSTTTINNNNNNNHFGVFNLRCRNFDSVATQTWPNLQHYARTHGYRAQDNSHLLDPSRPPAWSKILAVQHMMSMTTTTTMTPQPTTPQPVCQWVLWLDADVVIMNSSIALESILPSEDSGIDLVVTSDRRFTVNSGVWLLRNSDWSRTFLEDWWNMKRWVRSKGLSLSGDNDAFGHLVRDRLGLSDTTGPWSRDQIAAAAATTTNAKLRMPARCTMNSFGVFVDSSREDADPSFKTGAAATSTIATEESHNFFHKGDFIAHASGIDQKAVGVELLLQRAT